MAVDKKNKPRLDVASMLQRVLSLGQHLRLMLILACIGSMGGLIAFCYSTPIYYSSTLVNWQVFGLPFHDETENRSGPASYANLWRELKIGLEANSLLKDAAVKMGVAHVGDDIDTVRGVIRVSRFFFRDTRTLVHEVMSSDPKVVRDLTSVLIQVYEENQAKGRKEYREKAAEKYLSEVDQLKNKINEGLQSRLEFEKQSQSATLTLRQERLLKLPVDIERCKAQVSRMTEIYEDFKKAGEGLDTIGKLSLLSAFDKEWRDGEKAQTGDVVRRAPNTSASTPFMPAMPSPTKVDVTVVGPDVAQATETWRKLEKEAREIEEEIKSKSADYLPGHALMKGLQSRLDDVRRNLEGELVLAMKRFGVEFERVKNRLPELEAQLPEYYKTVKEYEQFRKDYALLERGQEDWSAAHSELSKRIAAIQFGDQKNQIDLKVSTQEVLEDRVPVSPTFSKSLMISVALSLGLGIGIPFLLEVANSTVSRLPQLESRLGITGLGMVPNSSKELLEQIFRSPALGSKVPNFLLECFRVIRSNIILHPGREGRSQVVMVTSARPSEGKSTNAANLAWAFFSMGDRTLLIDTDLRRGRVHTMLGMNNELGLSSYFSAKAKIEDVIQKTENPNLDVIPRGPFVPGASEYLCREIFEKLINGLRGKYDRIILDAPPVLGLSETVATQRVADGVVLVVRAENTTMTDVDTTVEQLRRSDTEFFGFILNRLDLSKPSNHYFYYYSSPYYYSDFDDGKEGA
ncbi:MAG: polysaccharide biosynthesis tyrosine autokinase [Verrucomicrobiaceae bacterium]|nr:polysaccharide biosynthesis tyrosine autokinase [Verrucomicrobiaceae bacterium]